jgi:Family of unknown function (DUF5675)
MYTCQRGIHQLGHPGSLVSIETFEVMNVPGHTGILFHTGNTDEDSEGCILLGDKVQNFELLDSRNTFQEFMKLMEGKDTFQLGVGDAT